MWTETLKSPRIGVRVRHSQNRRKDYILDDEGSEPILLMKAGTQLIELAEDERVLDSDGTLISPTGRFFRTAETIDPYHLVLDIF